METKAIQKAVKMDMMENPTAYPFIAKYWDVEVFTNDGDLKPKEVYFGHYETKSSVLIPFYKPISKIIDLSQFYETATI
ncbi:hypothetical protein E6C50_08550 [Flavobacterium supellecticarium]|uniref:Uncharacterized protein n=1 Tax=Flavobacterium supellecticarium TaxID=2565924 RepID=A0A4S4A0L2_9FLAO|nr:hypothetical protein [Flavobacterium supellecticarium]THF51795.1 hypothetical protein E6C50_08550 [Flavobacterium supellecticarium]